MPARLCLFCPTPLGPKTRFEHPVLDRIGGRVKRRDLICDECNHGLAAAVDTPLAKELITLCHALWVRSGSGEEPPTLRGVPSELGPLDIGPGGAKKSEVAWPVPVKAADGPGFTFALDGRNTDETVAQIVHSARRIGIKSVDELMTRLRLPDELWTDKKPIPTLILPFGLGDPSHLRSIAKSAIEILAIHDPDAARSADLETVRRYVKSGDGDRANWIFANGSELPFSDEEMGPFPHVVSVWAEAGTPMSGRVTFFGHFHFCVLLAEVWNGAALAISHVVNPLAERHHGIREFTVKPPAPTLADFPTGRPDPRMFDELCNGPFLAKAQPIGMRRNVSWLASGPQEPSLARLKSRN